MRRLSCLFALTALAATVLSPIFSAGAAPDNLGLGLKELVEATTDPQNPGVRAMAHERLQATAADFPLAVMDAQDRVLVDVYPNGTVPIHRVIKQCRKLGGEVTSIVEWYRSGVLDVWMPTHKVAKLARYAGVSAVQLSPQPSFHAGSVTSQGAKALHSDTVNATYKGAGITVGVLSDSYDKNTSATKTAAQDVASSDLPGAGNTEGYTTPVNVVEDYSGTGTDEGRAMCQIVHDVAPASPLAFATANGGLAHFANNIVALAVNAGCKVICDDVSYGNEPMFSDGVASQAVDRVAKQNGVAYFSSAGNDGNSGYIGTFNGQANNGTTQGLLSTQGGIDYSTIPPSEQAVIDQFQSFATSGGNPVLVQRVLIPANGAATGVINFQWDDPSDVLTGGQKSVTTDYDLLVFSVSGGTGTYQSTLSLTHNNFSTNEPIELSATGLTAGTQYEFVIVRTNRPPTPANPNITVNQATHLRWTLDTDAQQIIADFVTPSSPNSFGHAQALNCNGTAAYRYDRALNTAGASYNPIIEAFSSNGNAAIYFDAAGNRLATAETRKQPTLAAIDGVDTTFFGTDADGDSFPNFFGTSAAAPHAAGCAALLLNAAAGKAVTLTPADVRAYLVNTTQGQSDQDPAVSKATLTQTGVNAAVTSVGFTALDHTLVKDPYSLNVSFTGVSGQQLTALTITLPSGLVFYPATYPFTAGPATGATPPTFTTTPASPANFSTTVTLNFSSFDPGDTLALGVARYLKVGTTNVYRATTNADVLAGTMLSATVTGANAGTYSGTLANTVSRKWNYKSGFGLIDINAAINALP